jgi:hypothetical protein
MQRARGCAYQSESRVQSRDTSIAQRSGEIVKMWGVGVRHARLHKSSAQFEKKRCNKPSEWSCTERHVSARKPPTCRRTKYTLTRVRARTHTRARAHTRTHTARRKLTVPSLSRFKSSFSIDFSNRDAMSAFFSLLASRRSIFLLTPTSLRCVLSLSLRIRIRY